MLDYGGKTREQEAEDSARMLGSSLVALLVVLIVLGGWLVWPTEPEPPAVELVAGNTAGLLMEAR